VLQDGLPSGAGRCSDEKIWVPRARMGIPGPLDRLIDRNRGGGGVLEDSAVLVAGFWIDSDATGAREETGRDPFATWLNLVSDLLQMGEHIG
jgi:hypothetical protein